MEEKLYGSEERDRQDRSSEWTNSNTASSWLHNVTIQKTVVIIIITVRTLNFSVK
jgi:hypothetical protein